MCYQLEKLMRENAENLGDKDRAPLEKAVQKTREVAKGNDTQAIRSAISELEQASQAFSKTLYERAQTGAQPDQAGSQPKGPSGSGDDDDAIDAEFEVKD
jgi:molecular chaperone DnaK